jgi:hypothetical protein
VSGGFSVLADGNHGAGSTPGKAGVWTTATGATSATQRIHVDASGKVGIAKLSALTEILDIVGNMAVSGTVDGRDIATDGSKLDGIEAGADVTDFTNVAAALAAATGVIDINGQDLDDVGNAQIKIFCQSATPTAYNNYDLWWETDARILWFWFGTRWLSCQLFAFTLTPSNWSGGNADAAQYSLCPAELASAAQHDIYVVDLCSSFYAPSDNDGSNYWTATLNWYSTALVTTSLASHNTSAQAASTFNNYKTSINTHLDLSALGTVSGFQYALAKTGAPDPMIIVSTMTFRWAHT